VKEKINCPFWNEKKGECKVLDILLDLTEVSKQVAKIIEAHAPPKTSLGPVPGSHGQIEGHSPVEMATVETPLHPPFFSFLKDLSGDKQPKLPQIGEKENQKKKQEYWEKELKKMDEEEKEK